METVNIHFAKTHLSKLLERARHGERIVIAKAGEPVAELGPLTRRREIVFGLHEGELDIDFDALEAADDELDEEMATHFYGESEPGE